VEEYIIITFASTNFAMQAENELKTSGVKHQIIPTPRQITLSCGLSVMTPVDNLDAIRKLISDRKIINKAVYRSSGSGREKTLEIIEDL
jgi:hypothetical protein